MATTPFGTFADLSPYRRAVSEPVMNPLDALIAGFGQGQAIRELPQTIADRRQAQLENELTRRLNMAIAQQRLTDLQNPGAALAREVQKALALKSADPTSAVVPLPVGLESEIIAQPGALSPQQQLALESGGAAPVVAPVGAPIVPIAVAGRPTGFGRDITGATEATRAIAEARGDPALERLILGINSREAIAREGAASKERIAATKGGAKGLTANAAQTILGKAAFEGVDLEDAKYKDEDGNYKITEINLESNQKRRQREDLQRQAKLDSVSGKVSAKQRDELASLYLVQAELERFRDIISDPTKISGEPGPVQNALAIVAAQPSTGIFSSLGRQFAQANLSDESKLKENVRSTITSAVNAAISGKVITKLEATQLGFTPKGDDTIKELIAKAENLEVYLKNKEDGILKSLGSSTDQPTVSPATAPKTADDYLNKFK